MNHESNVNNTRNQEISLLADEPEMKLILVVTKYRR